MNGIVTIVTPCFNSEGYILPQYKSICSQTYKDWEWFVVDDCSADSSVRILSDIAHNDSRVRVFRLEVNSGAAVARNKAIEMAGGRYVAFLDSDDLWRPDKLEKQINFMEENQVAFSYSAYEKVDENGRVLGVVGVPQKVTYTDLLKVCSIGCLTAIYDTKVLGKVYMPLIRKRQDLGLWLRILKKIPYAYATPGVLASYRVRKDSISANKRVAAQYTWKLYREVEELSFIRAAYYFTYYAVNGMLRTKFPRLARMLGVLK